MQIHVQSSWINKTWQIRILLGGMICLVSFLYGLQHVLFLYENDWKYKNVVFMSLYKSWDAGHYLTQIKEVYEGNHQLSNAYFAEYKNTVPSPWPLFPLYITASIGKKLGLQVQHLAVFMDFCLPPLIFFFTYLLLATICSVKSVSIAGAYVLVLTPHFLHVPFSLGRQLFEKSFQLWSFVSALLNEAHCFNCFSRPINPQLTFTFLIMSLCCFFKGITTQKYRYFALAVMMGITLSYSYVFFSTYLYVVLGTGTLISLCLKKWNYCRASFFVLALILIGSAPFWYMTFTFPKTELSQMAWMTKSHAPIFTIQFGVILAGCGILWHALRKGILRTIPGIAALSLLLSGVICVNQHVITGIFVQPGHYINYVIPQSMILAVSLIAAEILYSPKKRQILLPFRVRTVLLTGGILGIIIGVFVHPSLFTIVFHPRGMFAAASNFTVYLVMLSKCGVGFGVFFFMLGIFLRDSSLVLRLRLRTFVSIGILAYATLNVGIIQFVWYQGYMKTTFGFFQQLHPALEWLNAHTEAESVILGCFDYMPYGNTLDNVITLYTHNNVYASYHAQYYPVPAMTEIVDRVYNMMLFMGMTKQEDVETTLREMILPGSFQEYQEKLHRDVYTEVKHYRADYLLYGPRERQKFTLDPEQHYSFLQKAYDDGMVKIYRIL